MSKRKRPQRPTTETLTVPTDNIQSLKFADGHAVRCIDGRWFAYILYPGQETRPVRNRDYTVRDFPTLIDAILALDVAIQDAPTQALDLVGPATHPQCPGHPSQHQPHHPVPDNHRPHDCCVHRPGFPYPGLATLIDDVLKTI